MILTAFSGVSRLMTHKNVVPLEKLCSVLACLCMTFLLSIAFAEAQSTEDVHIVPRTGPDQLDSKTGLLPTNDSAPQAHGRPIRVAGELVLVPVAVTDATTRPLVHLRRPDV